MLNPDCKGIIAYQQKCRFSWKKEQLKFHIYAPWVF